MTNIRLTRTQAAMAFSPRAVASSGLTTIAVDTATDGALLELGNGVALQGIKVTDDVGIEKNGVATHAELAVFVRCRNGNAGTIAHQHGSMSAAHRIRVVGASADLAVSADSLVLLLYSTTESRWLAYDLQRDSSGDVATAIAAAISAHEAAGNPHPQYTRSLRYSGTTAGAGGSAGTYSVTFNTPFSNVPNIGQPAIIGGSGTDNRFARVTSRSTTGFTVTAYTRTTVNLLGVDILATGVTTTNGVVVDVLVTSND